MNLLLILIGWKKDGVDPIVEHDMSPSLLVQKSVDPLPQVMVLISIIMGLCVLCLMVAFAIRIYHRYGTFDITEINKMKH